MTAPAPPRGARPEKATRKGRQTDEAFREAARLVFARDGYLNAKISDIAAQAGRSVASFYNYYDTKADLLIALAEEFHAEATQMAILPYRSGLAPPDVLREAVAGFKCPTGVTVVSELPRNATGKVLRAALREPFWVGRDRLVS